MYITCFSGAWCINKYNKEIFLLDILLVFKCSCVLSYVGCVYLDCVECMACSDNVVRAGLTPKLKDVPTLCNMLTYICESGEMKLFNGVQEDDNTTVFRPPVQDFAVAKITVGITKINSYYCNNLIIIIIIN